VLAEFKVGDVVRVTNPDPNFGAACILAGTGYAFRVVREHGNWIELNTKGVYLMPDTILLETYEVTKVDEKPFNEK
jgi:hypothetical protein